MITRHHINWNCTFSKIHAFLGTLLERPTIQIQQFVCKVVHLDDVPEGLPFPKIPHNLLQHAVSVFVKKWPLAP